jgi:hypothetical protein
MVTIKVLGIRVPDWVFRLSVLGIVHGWRVRLGGFRREPRVVGLWVFAHFEHIENGDAGGYAEEAAVGAISVGVTMKCNKRTHKMTMPKLLAAYDSVHFFSVPKANVVQLP